MGKTVIILKRSIFSTISIILFVFTVYFSTLQIVYAFPDAYSLPTLTGNQAVDVVNIARSQLGYTESGGTIYGNWWNGITNWGVDYTSSGWCSMFACWCVDKAGLGLNVGYSNMCAKPENYFNFLKSNGAAYDTNFTSNPQKGDLLFWTDHVAIVTDYNSSNRTVSFIGGNQGNGAGKVSESSTTWKSGSYWGSQILLGYGRPKYKNAPIVKPELSVNQVAPDILNCSWKKIDGANQYYIEMKDSSGNRVARQWTKELSWRFDNLSPGTYTARIDVLASNGSSMGEESKKATVSIPAPVLSDGTYHIISKRVDGMSVSVYNQSSDARANIELADVDPEADISSLINVERLSNGYYKLTMCSSGKVLDCEGWGTSLGTNIIQDNDSGQANQQWYIKSAGDGWFYLVCKCNLRYMDVNANNWNVQMWEGNGTDAQKFKFIAKDPSAGQTVEDGNYYIFSTVDTSYCVDVDGNSYQNNANVSLYKLLRHDNQVFEFTYLGNGYYRILNKQSRKALEAAAGVYGNVFQNSWSGSDAQKWIVKDVGNNSFSLINKASGLFLDLSGGTATNSKNIQVYYSNNTSAQKWQLSQEVSIHKSISFDLQGGTVDEPFFSYPVNRFNAGETGELVIYNNSGQKPGPHHYWIEAAVDAGGKVIAIKEYGSDDVLTVPNEGFIISGHVWNAPDGASFTGKLKTGDYVGYDVNSMTAYAYHDLNSYLVHHKYINDGASYGVLPVPTKENYYFDGWYTEAEGGSKISASSAYTSSLLFAHWKQKDNSEPVSTMSADGHTYELYDLSLSWTEARAFCEEKGGHLVTLTTADENAAVLNLAKNGTKGFYAIGLESEGTQGTWRWITGEDNNWENFDKQFVEGNTPGEPYAYMISIENPPNKQSGEWIDSPDKYLESGYYYYGNGGFICEYDKQTTDISECTITIMNDLFVYDGSEKTPEVTVKYGNITLKEHDHYEVAYKDNIHAGDATVTVIGKNQYKGSAEETFKIEKAEQLLSVEECSEELEENASIQLKASGIGAITYMSSDEGTAIIDSAGLLTGKKAGNVTVTITAAGDEDHKEAEQALVIGVVHREETLEAKGPTCTEDGLTEGKKCAICGDILEEQQTVKALGHTEEIVLGKDPTCTEPGLTDGKKCSVCDAVLEEQQEIEALGHKEEVIKGTPATCTEDGLSDGVKCSVCDTVLTEQTVIAAPGHQFGDWEPVTSSDCVGAGSEKRTCEVCGFVETNNLNPEGHSWEEAYTIDREATCTADGSKSIHCSKCDAIKESKVIPATGHNYGEWENTKDPTCTEPGSREKMCSACGDIATEEIKALGHDWEENFTTDQAATCTGDGSKSIHCTRCDTVKAKTTIPAKGHNYGRWKTTKEPTCKEKGSQELECSFCGDKIIEDIPETSHLWSSKYTVDKMATCSEEGSKSIHCTKCDEKKDVAPIPKTDHVWNKEYTVDKAATCTAAGSKSIHCSKCEATKDPQIIKATGHKEEIIPGKAATETSTGLTEGKKCSVCGTITTPQQVISKLVPKPAVPTIKPQKAADGTTVGAGASQSVAEVSILATTSDEGPAGTKFNLLQAQMSKVAKKSITIKWRAVSGAKYIVYGAPCGKKMTKLAETDSTMYIQTGLKKGTYYKYLVLAVKDGKVVSTSKTLHIATSGGKVGNNTKVTLSKKKLTLKAGKSKKLKATVKKGKLKVKKHRKVMWESSDPTVATVSNSGKIKAVSKGKAIIYAYAQNGKFAKCIVTVK